MRQSPSVFFCGGQGGKGAPLGPDRKQMWQGRKQRGGEGSQEMAAPVVRAQGAGEIKQPPLRSLHHCGQGWDAQPSRSALHKLLTPPLTLCPACSLPAGGDPCDKGLGLGGDWSLVLGPLMLAG